MRLVRDGSRTVSGLTLLGDAYLGNGDASSRSLANVANLAAATANDASNHVGGDANVLSLDFLSILVVGRRAASGSVGIRATAERS